MGKNKWEGVFTGIVVSIYPDAAACNIRYVPTGTLTQNATASDCLHVDDVEIGTVQVNRAGEPMESLS